MPDTWQLSALASLAACPPHGAGPRLTCRRPTGRAMLPPCLPPSLGPGRAARGHHRGRGPGPAGRSARAGQRHRGGSSCRRGKGIFPPLAGAAAVPAALPKCRPPWGPAGLRWGFVLSLSVCLYSYITLHCRSHTPLRDVHMNLACTEITTPS